MRKLMMTTAIVAASSFGALAQTSYGENGNDDAQTTAPGTVMGDNGGTYGEGQADDHGVDAAGSATEDGRIGSPRGVAEAPEGYVAVDTDMPSEEQFLDAHVYDAEGDEIGAVGEVITQDSGAAREVIVDIGGFLGFGGHSVALPLDGAEVLHNAEQDSLRIHMPLTREQLESLPEYEG